MDNKNKSKLEGEKMNQKRVLLCIMDGFGINKDCSKDATKANNTTNFDHLKQTESYTQIKADGQNVGLPEGQMGNSEVGHLNLGAGRIVYQELSRINNEIKDWSFFKNEDLNAAIDHAIKNNSSVHFMGLVSDGGVHSSLEHLKALIKLAYMKGLKNVYIHAFLDGRDTDPKSASKYLQSIEDELKKYKLPPIASVMGRYYAMDRDNRWDRVEKAYNCLVLGLGEKADNSIQAVENSYKLDKYDEFVKPTVIGNEPKSRIKNSDSVIFFNFRPDRAREITKALTFEDFSGFERLEVPENLYYVCFTQYDETFTLPVAFKPQKLVNILSDVLEKNKIHQFRTAETEKYAHITFFFNGGVEKKGDLETRVLVNSPKVATYDLQPEMSAKEVCNNVLEALNDRTYQFILVNFANCDMVGHTGNFDAVVKAVKVVDECVGKIAAKAIEKGVTMLLTADHGNAECMENPITHAVQTAHTTNEVPFLVINGGKKVKLAQNGKLADVAPTVLKILEIEKPKEMTGKSLIEQ